MAQAQPRTDETRVLRLSRTLAASRARVFRAFTEPEQLIRWWGPRGVTISEHALDVRPGGAWRTVMTSPEGKHHVVSGVYREIVPHERLVFTWAWDTDGQRGHETVVTIALEEQGAGTALHLTQELFESENSRDQHQGGWTSSLDCLEELLADV